MAPAGGIWAPVALRAFKHAFKRTSKIIKARLNDFSRPVQQAIRLDPALVRSTPKQPVHPIARLRQAKGGRWYTTQSNVNAAVRRFMSTAAADTVKYNRAAFPRSATSDAVSRLAGRAPFASTLRPNLSGAFPRTAGGYSLGGRTTARYFSHIPAAPSQVVNNVSAAVRAFWLSGQKAQFDGLTPRGEKRFRSVSAFQEETGRRIQSIPKFTPGSYIDFSINPTVTALTPLGATFPFAAVAGESAPTLNTEGFLDVLSIDFARVLQDLVVTMNDLKRLSSLGDLPITLENKSTLRVRFPGCDAETVEKLCDEVGMQRGIIYQDEDFDATTGTHMALMFPYAPTSEHALSSPGGSLRSQTGHDFEEMDEFIDNPWMEGYESASEAESTYFTKPSENQNSSDFEGLEGIYRFLEKCDQVRRIE